MNALVAAVLVLLLGAAGCVLPLPNRARAGIGLVSQVLATALVFFIVMSVLVGGLPLTAELAWAYRWGPCACVSTRWARSFSPGRCP